MSAPKHANNASLSSLQRPRSAGDALNSDQDMVSVHGVFDGVPRNKYVAVEAGHGSVWHDKSVAVVVQHQPALDFVAVGDARVSCILASCLGNRCACSR